MLQLVKEDVRSDEPKTRNCEGTLKASKEEKLGEWDVVLAV